MHISSCKSCPKLTHFFSLWECSLILENVLKHSFSHGHQSVTKYMQKGSVGIGRGKMLSNYIAESILQEMTEKQKEKKTVALC